MSQKTLLLVVAALVLVPSLLAGGLMASRGIRNNNPLNIRKGINWLGLDPIQSDSDFARFITLEHGIRAAYRNLLTYRNRDGLKTVADIVSKWAPPVENKTAHYIKYVSAVLGVTPNTPLALNQYPGLIQAMAKMETGADINIKTIVAGVQMS